jgi:hypothetical protein
LPVKMPWSVALRIPQNTTMPLSLIEGSAPASSEDSCVLCTETCEKATVPAALIEAAPTSIAGTSAARDDKGLLTDGDIRIVDKGQ